MCLIIDTNVFGSVFNKRAKEHTQYAPVIKWLITGNGKMIYGGTKYNDELRGSLYRRMLAELARSNSLVKIPSDPVDKYAADLKVRVPDKAFDDEHIVALVAISKCCVVCTDDKKSLRYLKRLDLYPRGVNPPKIYKRKSHAKLCCNTHIVAVCQ